MRNLFALLTVALMATWGALNVGCAPSEAPPATPPAAETDTSSADPAAEATQVAVNVEGMK